MTSASSLISVLFANPAVILFVGAALAALFPDSRAGLRRPLMLVFIFFSGSQLYRLGLGEYGALSLFGESLVTLRVDRL
ncbi:MAG: hypothetical protein RIC52_09640, partial [Amphiplicatus sp.]